MGQTVELPAVLDLNSAAIVHHELNSLRGKAVELDASGVERLGGVCLQLLLAARAAWAADGHEFRIINQSDAFAASARLMAANDLLADVQEQAS